METVPILTDNTRSDHAQVSVASLTPRKRRSSQGHRQQGQRSHGCLLPDRRTLPVQREFFDPQHVTAWWLTATKTWPTGWPS